MAERTIQVGLIGLGVVGCGTLQVLRDNLANIEHRLGAKLRVKRMADIDLDRPRPIALDRARLTTDAWELIYDPEIDIIVEAVGGTGAAREFVLGAIRQGKNVVTSNKELIAKHGREILAEARAQKVDVCFEGSVGGGIPIIQPLKETLVVNRITRIMGIVNGTTNYILTRMKRAQKGFAEALAEAQEQGYAEADPTNDVEGHDAAYKIAILAAIAFDSHVDVHQVYREGIARVDVADLRYADELGYEIKLLAIAKDRAEDMEIRVHPVLIPQSHPLASIDGVFNAILVHGEAVDDVMFYGRGAGALPTGSAMVGDLIEISRNILHGSTARVPCTCSQDKPMRRMEDITSRFYLRMWVADRPGVIAAIAGILGKEQVSIASVVQKEARAAQAEIVWITHEVVEGAMRRALAQIEGLDCVREISSLIRVEDTEGLNGED